MTATVSASEPGVAKAGETYDPPSTFSSREYIPALDGLRGIAILAVMLHHFRVMVPKYVLEYPFVALESCGWIGVDLFFALSGFLITGILIDTRGAPGYARTFYARRALRIVPLYLVAVFVLSLVFDLGDVKWWYWTHSTNLLIAHAGRWNVTAINTTHLWSLAVEEQFYLVWPLLVALCPPRRLGLLCVAVAAGGAVFRVVLLAHGTSPVAIYTLMPTHMDGLALGGALAVARRRTGAWSALSPWARSLGKIRAPLWGILVALAVLVMLALNPGADKEGAAMQAIGYPLVAVAAVTLVAATIEAPPGSALDRWLSSAMLRTLGKYSYCLYIVHYPLAYFLLRARPDFRELASVGGPQMPGQLLFFAIAGAASFAIAWVSYRVLESPFLRLKRHFPMRIAK